MRLLIIDLSCIFWTAWHAKAGSDINAGFELTVGKVRQIADRFDRVAIALDSPRSFRKQIAPDYKANRPPKDPAAIDQLHRAQEVLALDGFPMFVADGYEGDDVVASFATWARPDHEVTIFGADKDLLSCIREGVVLLNSNNGKVFDVAAVEDVYKVPPSKFNEFLALCGDTSDNVKGAKGCGPVNAARLLREFKTLAGICKAALVEEGPDGKPLIHPPSIRKAILEALGHLDKSRELVTLRTDAPCDFSSVLAPRVQRPLTKAVDRGDAWEPPEDEDESDAEAYGAEVVKPVTGKTLGLVTMPGDDAEPADVVSEMRREGTVTNVERTKSMSEDSGGAQTQGIPAQGAERTAEQPRQPLAAEAPASPGGDVAASTSTAGPPREAPRPKAAETSTALAVIDPSDPRYAVALEPRTMQQAAWLALQAMNSRCFGLPNEETALAAIMIGRSYGIGAMTMMRNVHLIEGKLALHAHLIMGIVMSSPLCEYFDLVESTSTIATYVGKRKGARREVSISYTIEDAELAGLLRPTRSGKPSNWTIRPRPLLRKQAGVELARAVWPDLTAGLYSPDELGDDREDREPEFIEPRRSVGGPLGGGAVGDARS